MKKFLRIAAIFVAVIIVLLFLVPVLFKDRLLALAKKEINNTIEAKAEFSDATVSFFRHFPKLSLELDNLSISGIPGFEMDTLLVTKHAGVSLNLLSIIKGDNIKVSSIIFDSPRVYATVNKQGKANWDIVKTDSTQTDTTASKPFRLELNRYELNNAYIKYIDSAGGMETEIRNLTHSGSGNFNQDQFVLKTSTRAEGVSFSNAGIPWLSKANVSLDADVDIDNKTNKYSFSTGDILVNELPLSAKGYYQLTDDSTSDMDISFQSKTSDFKHILSLVPAVYQKDFKSVETQGQASFDGFVKGRMQGEQLPAYSLNATIANGYFKYPDLPVPVKNIQLKLKVSNPDGITDHLQVEIPAAHVEMNNQPVDFRFLLRNPETIRYVDGSVKGALQLAEIKKFMKLSEGTDVRGNVNADITIKGSLRNASAENADKFYAAGSLLMNDFFYRDKDYPKGIQLDRFAGSFNPRETTIQEARGKYLSSTFNGNGQLFNLFQYLFDKKALNAVFNVSADQLLVSEFMADSTSQTPAAEPAPFIVPSNLNVTVNAAVGKVLYEKLTITDARGSLALADESIRFNQVEGKALDGSMVINGSYSTKNSKTHPAIGLRYSVKDLDVQKTFLTFNTVQKLMPIGKWLGGKMNSELLLTGNLTRDLMPDFATLTGNGNLFLIEGLLQKFKPLEKLAEKIHVNELKEISMREVREVFEFTNGKVLVKPFNLAYKDIKMEVGGSHGFDQSLDYVINLVIPRSRFGTEGNQLVDDLVSKALARGIPVKPSETVNLKVNLTGFINDPQFRIDLKEAASSLKEDITRQAKEFANEKIDSARKVVKDTLQSLKKEAINEVSEQLKKQIFKKTDSVSTDTTRKQKPEERIKEAGKGILDKFNPLRKPKTADTTKKGG